jgi:hypothetical protein
MSGSAHALSLYALTALLYFTYILRIHFNTVPGVIISYSKVSGNSTVIGTEYDPWIPNMISQFTTRRSVLFFFFIFKMHI